jgi:hypothetical protein
MQEDDSIIPDTKKSQQIVSQMEHDENSNSVDFDKIINSFFCNKTRFIITLLSILFIVFILPFVLVNTTVWLYKGNLTLAGMYTTTTTNFLLAAVTGLYVLLTGALVTHTKEATKTSKKALAQSEKALAQSEKEKQIREIKTQLEEFYYPLLKLRDYSRRNSDSVPKFEELLSEQNSLLVLAISDDIGVTLMKLRESQQVSIKCKNELDHVDHLRNELLSLVNRDIVILKKKLADLKK